MISVQIQMASNLTAQTLAKLESRFELFMNSTIMTTSTNAKLNNEQWMKLGEKALLILAGIIGALIGQKIL